MKSRIISDSGLELRIINSRRYVKPKFPRFPENANEHEAQEHGFREQDGKVKNKML